MSESSSMKAQQAGEGAALALDAFLPYRAARLATALSRALAAQYEQRYDISVAEWRVLVHLTQQTEISVRDIFTRVDMDRARVTLYRATINQRAVLALSHPPVGAPWRPLCKNRCAALEDSA